MVRLKMKWPKDMKSSSNQSKTSRKGTKEGSLKEGATIVESWGTGWLIVGT